MLEFIAGILIKVPITLLALTVHECAHGWVSTKLGDPTPRYQGRLSLNPLAHLDPVGTLLMIFTGFGWAKPVQVNPSYYKNVKKGMAAVAAAGPISNLLLAFIGVILLGITEAVSIITSANLHLLHDIFSILVLLNVNLMVFNLIPIPPLDGSKVLGMFLPDRVYYNVLQYERYCMLLIMVLSFSGVLDRTIGMGVRVVINLIVTPVFAAINGLLGLIM